MNFREFYEREVRRIPIPRTRGKKDIRGLSAALSVAVSSKAQRIRVGLHQPPVVLLGGLYDALLSSPSCAEGCHERPVLAAQDHYVWVRLVKEVVELGKAELFQLSLASAFETQKRAPPGLRGGDLLQLLRPEQPIVSIRKAHVHGYVHFSPVATHHLAEQAPSLHYPVVVAHPHLHAHAYILLLHG
jgi:hypothetical protein